MRFSYVFMSLIIVLLNCVSNYDFFILLFNSFNLSTMFLTLIILLCFKELFICLHKTLIFIKKTHFIFITPLLLLRLILKVYQLFITEIKTILYTILLIVAY